MNVSCLEMIEKKGGDGVRLSYNIAKGMRHQLVMNFTSSNMMICVTTKKLSTRQRHKTLLTKIPIFIFKIIFERGEYGNRKHSFSAKCMLGIASKLCAESKDRFVFCVTNSMNWWRWATELVLPKDKGKSPASVVLSHGCLITLNNDVYHRILKFVVVLSRFCAKLMAWQFYALHH